MNSATMASRVVNNCNHEEFRICYFIRASDWLLLHGNVLRLMGIAVFSSVRHAKMTNQTRFLRNNVEFIKTSGRSDTQRVSGRVLCFYVKKH